MLESLEGKRGGDSLQAAAACNRRPLRAADGGQQRESRCVRARILQSGGASYNEYGAGRSRGTIPLQLAATSKRPGLFELPFGLSLRELNL